VFSFLVFHVVYYFAIWYNKYYIIIIFTSPLKVLYCAFVRQTIENGSIIWEPPAATHYSLVERVERTFLNFVSYSLKINCPLPLDYTSVLKYPSLASLADRKHHANLKSLSKLILGDIDWGNIKNVNKNVLYYYIFFLFLACLVLKKNVL